MKERGGTLEGFGAVFGKREPKDQVQLYQDALTVHSPRGRDRRSGPG